MIKNQEQENPFPLSIEQVARIGAEQMLKIALNAELEEFKKKFSVYRNGFHKERTINSSVGPLKVQVPRTRSRVTGGASFRSSLIPPYIRKTGKFEDALPYFYLSGLSNNDFIPCFERLFGQEVSGLSSASISRLKQSWTEQMGFWSKRDLTSSKYCYIWADGIHFNLRLEEHNMCVLVLIGATEQGHKELIAVQGGYRESTESWLDLLRDLKSRNMSDAQLAIGDGALGFWKALTEVFPSTKRQRCWVHKTANVLDKLPKQVQVGAKKSIHDIYKADTKKEAEAAVEQFISSYETKYPGAVKSLTKHIEDMFSFYDFPSAHWHHIRSTNIIESAFSTVRLRTSKTRGQGTEKLTCAMVFKLLEKAQKKWNRLRGYELLPNVLTGTKFVNGEMEIQVA